MTIIELKITLKHLAFKFYKYITTPSKLCSILGNIGDPIKIHARNNNKERILYT